MTIFREVRTCALWLAIFTGLSAQGAVKLNGLFTDHMVLQNGAPVPVWGTADAHEKISVTFAGQSKQAEADDKGNWMVKLDPLAINKTADKLTVTGSNTITVNDVLVGEVWIASGQSNMGFPLNSAANAADELPKAQDDALRFFQLKNNTAAEPQTEISGGQWVSTTPDTAKGFSAVAYFFAKELRAKKDCPVGVIQGAWGGTPIVIWISLDGLKKAPPITKTLDLWTKATEDYEKWKANPQLDTDYKTALEAYKKDIQPAYDAVMKQYNADKAAGKDVGPKPQPSQPEPTNPNPMGMPSPSKRPHTPTVAFNAMWNPVIPYAIRGAIWYQGEEDGSKGLAYREWLPRLIEDWRAHWGYDFPFLVVQLPCNGPDTKPVADGGWPWLREAQFQTCQKVPKTGMAITVDVGDPANVHPADKVDVGQRLALVARKVAYGEDLVWSGPLYKDFTLEDNKIKVNFTETGGGLIISQAPWHPEKVEPFPTDKLIGFFIAGEDKNWVEADATIDGNSVMVSSPQVAKPVAVRYGWANSPRCNLYNKEGLPASPFRTDNW